MKTPPTKIRNLYLSELGAELAQAAEQKDTSIGNEIRHRIRLNSQLKDVLSEFIRLAKVTRRTTGFTNDLQNAMSKAQQLIREE